MHFVDKKMNLNEMMHLNEQMTNMNKISTLTRVSRCPNSINFNVFTTFRLEGGVVVENHLLIKMKWNKKVSLIQSFSQ